MIAKTGKGTSGVAAVLLRSFAAGAMGLAIAVGGGLVDSARAETTLRLLSSWTPNTSMSQVGEEKFIAALTEAGNGSIKVMRSGPEVVPPFEQLQPLSAGVFDLLYTTPPYHQAQTGVGTVIGGLLKADTRAWRELGIMDHINDYYRQNHGVEILAIIQTPASHFVLREPLGEDSSLSGRKLRTNAAWEGVVRELDGTTVAMSAADAYSAMQRGVIDGIAVPTFASVDYKLYEVGKYMTRPTFGRTTLALMANSAHLAALPEDQQQLIRKLALDMEDYGTKALAEVETVQNATMAENGVEETFFNDDVAGRLNELYFQGSLEIAKRADAAAVEALVELANSKDMLER